MAFGTAGSSGGTPPSSADAVLHLLEVMSDPKAAKDFLTAHRKQIAELKRLSDELAGREAVLVDEKAALEKRLAEYEKEFAAQELALQEKIKAVDRVEADRQAAFEKRAAELGKAEGAVTERGRDLEHRFTQIKQALT